jgi:hypothetical protein
MANIYIILKKNLTMQETKEKPDTGSQCCNRAFKLPVNRSEISDLRFYSAGGSTIIMVYVKDGYLYFSISFDCGQTWTEPKRFFQIGGTVNDINIASKDKHFVVALTIDDGKKNVKKAISGEIDNANKVANPKECEKDQGEGELINVAVGFRPWTNKETGRIDGEESVDFTYRFLPDGRIQILCNGHM